MFWLSVNHNTVCVCNSSTKASSDKETALSSLKVELSLLSCSNHFCWKTFPSLKSLSGLMFTHALYLKVLGHELFYRRVFRRLIELLDGDVFSSMEVSSSSCHDLFLLELPVVLADFGGISIWRFRPLLWLVVSERTGSLVMCLGFFGLFIVSFLCSCLWAFGTLSSPLDRRASSSS